MNSFDVYIELNLAFLSSILYIKDRVHSVCALHTYIESPAVHDINTLIHFMFLQSQIIVS